ncbi:kinase-like domain-containing protein [Hypoxylon crocopeplum]|nr:kinase-like domain-containing protein [Hypoxylon crocopeplum]
MATTLSQIIGDRPARNMDWDGCQGFLLPRWAEEPEEEDIRILLREMGWEPDVKITLLSGSFNRVYLLENTREGNPITAILRVSIAVEPKLKTESEVITMKMLREVSSLRVPRIMAYQSSANNQIGYEWILQEYLQGEPLPYKVAMGEVDWTLMEEDRRLELVESIAEYYNEMFERQYISIGNLFPGAIGDHPELHATIGPLVAPEFYWAEHYSYVVNRGPFRNSFDWLEVRLDMKRRDCRKVASSNPNVTNRTERIIKRLTRLCNTLFASTLTEPTTLINLDLSARNIIMSGNELNGVIDWECASVMPLWKACELPRFLQGKSRYTEPDESRYKGDDGVWWAEDDYRMHMLQYKRTILQKAFLINMERLSPSWLEVYNSPMTRLKKDFDLAVGSCDDTATQSEVEKWLNTIETGIANIRMQCGTDPDMTLRMVSSLGFTVRSLQDRIYDDNNVSDKMNPPIVGPEPPLL